MKKWWLMLVATLLVLGTCLWCQRWWNARIEERAREGYLERIERTVRCGEAVLDREVWGVLDNCL